MNFARDVRLREAYVPRKCTSAARVCGSSISDRQAWGAPVDPNSMARKRRSDVEVIEHSIREKAARKKLFAARRGQGTGGKFEANQGQAGNGDESCACASAVVNDCPAINSPGATERAVADAVQGVENHMGDSRAPPAVDTGLSVEAASAYAASTEPKTMDLAALWDTCFDISGVPGLSQEERRCVFCCSIYWFDLLGNFCPGGPGSFREDLLAN